MVDKIKIIDLESITYNCAMQPLLVLCKYYKNEYWKALLVNMACGLTNSFNCYECSIINDDTILTAMKEFYNIEFELLDDKENIYLGDNDIYIASIKASNYPFCKNKPNIADSLYHHFIIYGEIEDKYIIHDNFYRKVSYLLEKSILKDCNLKKCKFTYNSKFENKMNIKYFILQLFDNVAYMSIDSYFTEKYLENINFDISNITDKIKNLLTYINVCSKVIIGYAENNKHLQTCGLLLERIYKEILTVYYSLLKEYLKYGKVSYEFLTKKKDFIKKLLVKKTYIDSEIIKILNSKESTKNLLVIQLNEYLEKEVDLNMKIKDDLDQYSFLALVSYMEIENNLSDINLVTFKLESSYNEFLEFIFKEVILAK